MDIQGILAFIAISVIVLITPGVTLTFVVSQSLAHGKSSATPLALGVAAGDFICLLASVAGLKAMVWAYPGLEVGIQVLGAIYLIYIGFNILTADANKKSSLSVEQKRSKLFTGALWVTLLNPKSILFFGAFLPQFIAKEYDFFYVFLLLGLIFIAIAFLIAFACAYVCGSVKDSNKNIGYVNNLHRVAGLVLLLLGSVSLLSVYQYL